MSKKRNPSRIIATGATGVGKTYTSLVEFAKYVKSNQKTGKKARKVLIFDTNFEPDYDSFTSVRIKNVDRLEDAKIYKVRPKKTDIQDDKLEILHQLVDGRFQNGLLLIEDINEYLIDETKDRRLIGTIITNRHKDLDIVIHLQSLHAIYLRFWQNCDFLRMHFEPVLIDGLPSAKKKLIKFELLKIAQLIVNDEYLRNKHYYLYVDMRAGKLLNVSKSTFSKAAKSYLLIYKKPLKDSGLTLSKWINQKAKLYL